MKSALIFALFFAATVAKTVYFCEVPVTVPDTTTVPSLHLQGSSYGWENFNAISFNSFKSTSGDVEGRAAIKGDVDISQYSFGYELYTSGVGALDMHLPNSMVVGGNAKMVGGQTYPLGTGFPYAGALEGSFVGGTFTYSQTAVTRDTTSSQATVLADFDAAQTYFTTLSDAFAAMPANAHYVFQYMGLDLYCSDTAADTVVFSIAQSDFNGATYYTLHGCPDSKTIVVNIAGTGAVNFNGDNIHHRDENMVFNVIGSGRTVNVNTDVKGNLLAPRSTVRVNSLVRGLVVAGDLPNVVQINRVTCRPPAIPDVPSPCVGFETACAGLTNNVFSFLDMNVVSFGSFYAKSGDVEGRLAVANLCNFEDAYSVGDKLSTVNNIPDRSVAYSLICGGGLTWGNGALYPDGTQYLAEGQKENAYVNGAFVGPAHLADRVVSGSDLSSAFAAGKTCYQGYQSTLAARPANTVSESKWNGLFVTCNDAAADTYVLNVDGAAFSASTYTVTNGCNFGARWIINVAGSNNVDITGDSFPAIPGGIIYNILGSGRTITVHDTLLGGHVLSPDNTLNQVSGVIVGKVVVGDITMSLQINREDTCPNVVTITKALICSAPAAPGVLTAQIAGANDFRVGDRTGNGEIVAIDGNFVTFSFPLFNGCSTGSQIGTVKLASNSGRAYYPNQQTSSASSTVAAFAVVAVAALLL